MKKKVDWQDRSENARNKLIEIFSDINNDLYLENDVNLAHKFDVSSLTISNIRKELQIPPVTNRVLIKIKGINTKKLTKKELTALLGPKCPDISRIIQRYSINVKQDRAPVTQDTEQQNISKKFGGQDRAEIARKEMQAIFSDPNHDLYLEKDIALSRKFSVSRLTIYNIREELNIPPRTDRILLKVQGIDTKMFTKRELATLLGIKYQNLYKIIREYSIVVKPDISPIVSMIKFQKAKKTLKDAQLTNQKRVTILVTPYILNP